MKNLDPAQLEQRAEGIYRQRLKATLEKTHPAYFVAIEPESGEHYLGHTLSEAVEEAHKAHPQRLTYVLRVGDETAIHIGQWS